jgi:hypothetical protein
MKSETQYIRESTSQIANTIDPANIFRKEPACMAEEAMVSVISSAMLISPVTLTAS